MRKLAWILLFLPMACSRKGKLPKDILPQPKMQAIVWDLMSAGEFLNGYVLYRDTGINQAAVSQLWYEKVYQLHHVSGEQFRKSYDYYTGHPAIMRELLDSLARRKTPVAGPTQYGQAPKADSIKAAAESSAAVYRKQQAMVDSLIKRKNKLKKGRKRVNPRLIQQDK